MGIPAEDLKAIASILATGYLRHREQLRRAATPLDVPAVPSQTPAPQDPASRSVDRIAAPEGDNFLGKSQVMQCMIARMADVSAKQTNVLLKETNEFLERIATALESLAEVAVRKETNDARPNTSPKRR